jgi:hypothetical protein
MRNTKQTNPIQQVGEHVNKALEAKPFALELPLQLVIDKPVHKYTVSVRTLTAFGGERISWHGSPLQTIATGLTREELIKLVNSELEHPNVEGWRVYGGGSPSYCGLRVGDFIKPHLTNRVLTRLAKTFNAGGAL